MKQIIGLFIALLSLSLIAGCGGGSSSSNPSSTVVTPTLTSISPQTGGAGTVVSIQGSGFGSIQGANFVSYAGVTIAPTSWSDNLITVTIPPNAPSNGSFKVTVGGITSNSSIDFYASNPIISYISPQTANSGSQVVITGQYFGPTQGSSYVAFNAQNAQIISWSNTSITCVVPTLSGTNSGSVPVIVNLGSSKISNTYSFNVSNPSITNVSPLRDNIGSVLTINGQSFGQNQSSVNGTVSIGGQSAIILSWSDTAIQVRVPSVTSAGSQNVQVTVNGQQVYTTFIVEAPVASSFSPNPISQNQTLTISGDYFGNSSDQVNRTVSIEGYGLVSGVAYNDNTLSLTWPISDALFGTQTKTVTINIGGLSTTILITAN